MSEAEDERFEDQALADLPEVKIVRRELEQSGIDPVIALAVLLRTLYAHVDSRLKMSDEEHEAYYYDELGRPASAMDELLQQIDREQGTNGDFWKRRFDALGPGAKEDQLDDAGKLAGDLMMAQDGVREIIASGLDTADGMFDALAKAQGE